MKIFEYSDVTGVLTPAGWQDIIPGSLRHEGLRMFGQPVGVFVFADTDGVEHVVRLEALLGYRGVALHEELNPHKATSEQRPAAHRGMDGP